MKNYRAICLMTVVLFVGYSEQKIPASVPICRRSDPKISDCIINSIKVIQPFMASGEFGEGFKLPPQEPFYLNDISFGDSQTMKISLSNLALHGTTKFTIEKLRANIKTLKVDTIIVYPQLELTGNFHSTTHFFGATVKNEGEMIVKIGQSRNRISMKMQKFTENGKEYIRFENIGIKISGKPVGIQLKGLFGNNKTLNDIAAALIKDNPIFQPDQLFPHFEKSLSESMTSIANKIVYAATYDEIFPE